MLQNDDHFPPPSSSQQGMHVGLPQRAFRHIQFAYISAIVFIIILLLSAQLLIQISLREETQVRSYAQVIGTQALRLQSLEQDALNLTDKTQDAGQNALAFRASELIWEQVHAQMLTFALSADENGRLQSLHPYYQTLRESYQAILALEDDNPRPITEMSAQEKATFISAFKHIFYSTPVDLRGLVYITQSLNFEADTYVAQIQIIELVLFLLSILTLLSEWYFVIRPANHHLFTYVVSASCPSSSSSSSPLLSPPHSPPSS